MELNAATRLEADALKDFKDVGKSISFEYNGVSYILYKSNSNLYELKDSGLPAAGPVQKLVKSGTAKYNKLIDLVHFKIYGK